jgi:quercetin dioxygenase-like cupin family protein
LCHIVRGRADLDETTFVTGADETLQVGYVVHPAGHEIPRHQHGRIERHLTRTGEVVVVQRGRCEVDIYDEDRALVATRTLEAGDVLIMVAGGHGFRMVEDTVLLEMKQGPYPGPSEKEHF